MAGRRERACRGADILERILRGVRRPATARGELRGTCQEAGAKKGRIDAFWKGQLVVEHKSRGQDLDRAFVQALDYFPGIADRDLPRYVLVSDFARFRLYDIEASTHAEFALKDLHKHVKRFGFIAGYGRRTFVSDAQRVAFLFELYQKYTSLLPSQSNASKPKRKRKSP